VVGAVSLNWPLRHLHPKGHERSQAIAGVAHPFDDREVARRALNSQ
jgi:UDP-N-acetylmuramyl tripeptide synthase